MMILESDLPYAAKIIEPLKVSDRPEPISMTLSFIVAVLTGLVGGVVVIIIFNTIRNLRKEA